MVGLVLVRPGLLAGLGEHMTLFHFQMFDRTQPSHSMEPQPALPSPSRPC